MSTDKRHTYVLTDAEVAVLGEVLAGAMAGLALAKKLPEVWAVIGPDKSKSESTMRRLAKRFPRVRR